MNQLLLNPVFPPDIIIENRASLNYDGVALLKLLAILEEVDAPKRTATALMFIKRMINA
jgi:hypothetical protein